MNHDFFKAFPESSSQEWEQALTKALKGQTPSEALSYTEEIEELHFKGYYHPSEAKINSGSPGSSTYLRGGKFNSNDWDIVNVIPVSDAETMNKNALEWLMKGATSLRLDLNNFSSEDCDRLIQNIGLEFITTTFIYNTQAQFDWILSLLNEKTRLRIHAFSNSISYHKSGMRTQLIDGTMVSKAGGNSTQEIAYLLHTGHEKLFKLIEQGLSVDDASSQLKFRIGITNNYFVQVAKQRAFRHLWSQIVKAYTPEHSCSMIAYLEGETGFVNKSLKDPYTNLLRQTTEAMSAVVGGLDELTILPFDWRAEKQDWSRTNRLATNIALILKEESYLDKVLDPAGGSYALESLTQNLADQSWKLFQKLEIDGTAALSDTISKTAQLRMELFSNNHRTLIGINKFMNAETAVASWQAAEELPFGKELILERDAAVIPNKS